ncbi:hypothetical protein [Holospora undulata]|uniref:Uncharacterized protein n=1 Tax=Holospora undulata HU1 TaxID=1321371 RepID=A0A061JG21_9PROT|nr:hypothetical protein [Holospora undulata]ETZ04801.1 hypothetical protein K737_300780 [Holospora undulata HU1]
MKNLKSFTSFVVLFTIGFLCEQSLHAKKKKIVGKSEKFIVRESSAGQRLLQEEIAAIPSHKSVQFAKVSKKFWEKSHSNMSKSVSWSDFKTKTTEVDSLLCEYSFENLYGEKQNFVKIPGFDDGSCLWSHLGIVPQDMLGVMFSCVEILSDQLSPSKASGIVISEALEMIHTLDPLGNFTKIDERGENNRDIAKQWFILKENALEVLKKWNDGLEMHGGASISTRQGSTGFRLPNGSTFFRLVAKHLGVNIKIFNGSSSDLVLESGRVFECTGAKHWLYLLQDEQENGKHYDILVEKGKPVSTAIIEEMNSYLGTVSLKKQDTQ